MKKKIFLEIILFLFLGTPMVGQDEVQTFDTVKFNTELEGVEILGIRAGQNTPFAFSNLYRDDIKQLNVGKSIPYILEQTPSVISNSDDGIGVGYADMRIRGTDNQRINFTVNGIPINDAESQGTFFVNFPDLISSSSSVQVQRGVGSSTNGSGAFGASVNISNIDQSDEQSVDIINTYGSYNTWRHTIMAGTGRLRGGFNFDIRLSKISSDGYIERGFSDLKSLQFLSGWSSEDRRTSIKFNLFTGTERTGQSWNGVYQDSLSTNRRFNELGLKDDGTYYEDQTDNYQQDYYQFFFNHQFTHRWSGNAAVFLTRGRGYYNEYRMGESYADYGLPDIELDSATAITETSLIRQLWLDNYFYGMVMGARYLTNKSTIDIGASSTIYDGVHYGKVKWASQGIPSDYKWYDNDAYKRDLNAFIKWEEQWIPGLFSYIDLQVRNVVYNIHGFRKNPNVIQENAYTFFNPKVGLNYVRGKHRTFVSIAKAAKEPNRDDFEAGVEQVPKSESLYDLELGYQYLSSGIMFGANLYYMYYINQLINTGKINDVGAYTRQNVDKSYRAGLELFAETSISSDFDLQMNVTLSSNKIASFSEYIDDYDNGGQIEITHRNTDIALSPGLIGGFTFTYKPLQSSNHNLDIALIGKYISRQYLDNTSSQERSIDPYGILNLRATYRFHTGFTKNSLISFGVNNLFNKMYASKGYTYSYYYKSMQTYNYYFPQAGTNFNVTLALGF